MRTLALLFFIQHLVSCQQVQEKIQPLEANLASLTADANWLDLEKTLAPATNIIFQSSDGGQTWQDISAGLPKGLGVGRIVADHGQVFLTSQKGLYYSSSTAATPVWESEDFWGTEISGIFAGPTGLYLSSYQHGFFKKIPGAGLLIPMHNNLKDKSVRTVLESTDGTLFVGCESGIFKSTDSGSTWKHVFAEDGVNTFAEAEGVLVCATYGGLLRSTDGGEHWDWTFTEDGPAFGTSFVDGRFVTITQGGKDWQDNPMSRLRASADGGKTWQPMDEGFSAGQFVYNNEVMGDLSSIGSIRNINDVKKAGQYLFCSCDAGIFRSADWGKNWEPVLSGPDKKLMQLAVVGNVIYAVRVVGC
jgi:photosystem II stability/assembly factor-like uncharacterized protein